MVEKDCGVALEPLSPDQLIGDLAGQISSLSAQPERCLRLSAAARERIANSFTDVAYTAGIESAFARALNGAR